jgi:hypothetical protein
MHLLLNLRKDQPVEKIKLEPQSVKIEPRSLKQRNFNLFKSIAFLKENQRQLNSKNKIPKIPV